MTDKPQGPDRPPGREAAPPAQGVWQARVITLFPEAFPGVLGQSLTGRALDEGLWRLDTFDFEQ